MSTHNLVKSLRADRSQLAAEVRQLRAEVERLRAEANARAVEELTKLESRILLDKCVTDGDGPKDLPHYKRVYNAACENHVNMVNGLIAELSKPAAKESEPVKDDHAKCWSCGGQGYITMASDIAGMVGYAQTSCSRCGGTGKLHYVTMEQLKDGEPAKPVTGPNYLDQEEWGHTKPEEEPDWTVTLAAQAKVAYAHADETADEASARLLALVVQGLCNLGREVRRGGAK